MVVEQMQSLLQQQVEDDIREPVLTFPIPGLGIVGLLAPHPIFWLQLVVVSMFYDTMQSALDQMSISPHFSHCFTILFDFSDR